MRCAFCFAVFCSVVNFVVQLYLRAMVNKFCIVTYCKYVVKQILWCYVHFRIFAFTCIYFLPCLSADQSDVDKDKTCMKIGRKFFGRKGDWCSHQRRIQNPAKYIRWKNRLFSKYSTSERHELFLQKAPSLMFDKVPNRPLVTMQII